MKTSLAAALALALGAGAAAAAEATPAAPSPAASTPAAATPAAATPAPPTAAALGAAATILNDIGVKPSLDRVVPGMFAELQRQVLATRPELKDSLTQAVQTVSPDFVKTEQIILDDLAKFMAVQMTEQELKDTAAFYESPTGKKFAGAQGLLSVYASKLAGGWRDELSTDILARVHEEMKKSGNDF
jgi:hypothetical protein